MLHGSRSPSESKSNIVHFQLFPLRKTGKTDAYMMYKQDICINHICLHINYYIYFEINAYTTVAKARKSCFSWSLLRLWVHVLVAGAGRYLCNTAGGGGLWYHQTLVPWFFQWLETWVVQCQVTGLRKNRELWKGKGHIHTQRSHRKPFKMYVWDVDVPFQKKVI